MSSQRLARVLTPTLPEKAGQSLSVGMSGNQRVTEPIKEGRPTCVYGPLQ
jgi:hypothetical protein